MDYQPLRVLTDLTGAEATRDRTVVIATIEVSLPALWAALWGLIPAVILAGLASILFGITGALSGFAIGEAATIWAIVGRSSAGLKRRHYEHLMDLSRYRPGDFVLCGKPIDPDMATWMKVCPSSVPLLPAETEGTETWGIGARRQIRPRQVDPSAFHPIPRPRQARPGPWRTGVTQAIAVPGDVATGLIRAREAIA